jgi:hypothetical protein
MHTYIQKNTIHECQQSNCGIVQKTHVYTLIKDTLRNRYLHDLTGMIKDTLRNRYLHDLTGMIKDTLRNRYLHDLTGIHR